MGLEAAERDFGNAFQVGGFNAVLSLPCDQFDSVEEKNVRYRMWP